MTKLQLQPAADHPDLLAPPVHQAIVGFDPALAESIHVAEIDPDLADTAEFCAAYDVELAASANCIVVAGRRGEETSYAACVVLATTRADVNKTVRKLINARKVSFAPTEDAVALTGMQYGGITPIGLPADWRVLVDSRVIAVPEAVIGAGIRGAKIALPGAVLAALPGVEVIEGLAVEVG